MTPAHPHAPASDRAEAALSIQVLGDFAVMAGGAPVAPQAWRRTHARRLIQYLGSGPRSGESRHKLQTALWPDFDAARARNRLHHTLHWVRKALDDLPAATRPQIVSHEERVRLVLPPGALLDWIAHTTSIDADEPDAAARLRALEATLASHGGELAPDWSDQPEIDARRAWLAQRRDRALLEAIELARELGDDEAAIRHARQRARRLPEDMPAQRAYALLLCDCGRAEAALLHCTQLREHIERHDSEQVPLVDETIRLIQQHNNQACPKAAQPPALPMLVSRQALAAPRTPLFGYGALLAACGPLLRDPYTTTLVLVGPPGAGKSLLAAYAAHQWQGQFRHGAISVDTSACGDTAALGRALALALAPLVGHEPATPQALHAALAGKELLVLVDGPALQPGLLDALLRLGRGLAELKWLITARTPPAARADRLLRVDPALLLEADEAGAPTPAAQILAALLPRVAPATAAPAWAVLEQIAQACDGLPRALEHAAERLEVMAPAELLARLHADPAALWRGPAGASTDAGFEHDIDHWLAAAAPHERDTLAVLAACQGWLTRDDLRHLHGGSDEQLDAFIEQGTRRHHLRRRVRATERGPRSEFRVPRLLLAALGLANPGATAGHASERIASWIENGAVGAAAVTGNRAAWLDDRVADVAAVVERWMTDGGSGGGSGSGSGSGSKGESARARLLGFCLAHAAAWSLTRHPRAVHGWLGAALEHAPRAAQPTLLLARARLRLRLSQESAACDDAQRALQQLGGVGVGGVRIGSSGLGGHGGLGAITERGNGDALRQEALALLQRHGQAADGPLASSDALSTRGIDAAQALMQVARLAVQHGRYAHALVVCQQCIELFERFGLAHGQAQAHRYRARIALATGQLGLAEQSLAAICRIALPAARAVEVARVELFRAEIELNQLDQAAALERVQAVLAQPALAAHSTLAARGLQISAWAHHSRGALPLALALCREAHRLALAAAHTGMLRDAHGLEALISARLGQPDAALQHIGAALEHHHGDRPAPDLQFELVNAAELAALLGRPALAAGLLAALQAFGDAPDQALRPWIGQRGQALRQLLGEACCAAARAQPGGLGPADALRQLTLA